MLSITTTNDVHETAVAAAAAADAEAAELKLLKLAITTIIMTMLCE